jgi:hypothetical protein
VQLFPYKAARLKADIEQKACLEAGPHTPALWQAVVVRSYIDKSFYATHVPTAKALAARVVHANEDPCNIIMRAESGRSQGMHSRRHGWMLEIRRACAYWTAGSG